MLQDKSNTYVQNVQEITIVMKLAIAVSYAQESAIGSRSQND